MSDSSACSFLLVYSAAIRAEILSRFGAGNNPLPANLDVKPTFEGVLISLTDRHEFGMFALGSAEPDPKLVTLIATIGILMLIGIVKKNAIMMIDFALVAQRDMGMTPQEAIRQACVLRFRPILMTTLAMVFGMVPLAFALTEGSEQRAPMGQAVIGGVITSSLLTLVVVPVAYCYMDDLAQWFKRRLGRQPE